MKIILVDPNLVRTFLVIIFLILIMVRTLENNYFLVRTKLGYLRYNTGVFLWILRSFKNTYFEEHLRTAVFALNTFFCKYKKSLNIKKVSEYKNVCEYKF